MFYKPFLINKLFIFSWGHTNLFSKELRKIIRDSKWEDEYKFIFKVLTEYAIYNLHVFSSEDTGMINANIALPFSIVSKEKDRITYLKNLNYS